MIEKALARFYLFLNGYYPIQVDSPLTLFTGVVLVFGFLGIVLRGLQYFIGAESAQTAPPMMLVPVPTMPPSRQPSQLISGCVVTLLTVVLGLVALGVVALIAMVNAQTGG